MTQSPNGPQMPPRGGFHPEDRSPLEAYPTQEAPRRVNRSSKSWVWILAIVAVVLAGGIVVCCGGGYWVYQMAAGQIADQVEADIADHPLIDEHIGQIESLDLSPQKTAELNEPRRIVLTINGSKGDGMIIGTQEAGAQELTDLVLETADGERYPLEE